MILVTGAKAQAAFGKHLSHKHCRRPLGSAKADPGIIHRVQMEHLADGRDVEAPRPIPELGEEFVKASVAELPAVAPTDAE